jgi:hypothetical protein
MGADKEIKFPLTLTLVGEAIKLEPLFRLPLITDYTGQRPRLPGSGSLGVRRLLYSGCEA